MENSKRKRRNKEEGKRDLYRSSVFGKKKI
jgi:hypothetical protein